MALQGESSYAKAEMETETEAETSTEAETEVEAEDEVNFPERLCHCHAELDKSK